MAEQRIYWQLKHSILGFPKPTDFQLVKEDLPELKDGQVTIEALYLSPDPYQKLFSAALQPPCVMMGTLVAKIIRSKNAKFAVNTIVVSNHGWIMRDNVDPEQVVTHSVANFEVIPPEAKHPSHYLGLYGLTGLTAYFALIKVCQPAKGEIVFVNSAAGAVGHLVAQIAKILGCKVIGVAGTDEKVQWLKNDLGVDWAYNYKKVHLKEALERDVPEGIDCFFDNVGGGGSVSVLSHMKLNGRVAVVGTIDSYNQSADDKGNLIADPFPMILGKKLRIAGFHFFDYLDQMDEGRSALSQWLTNGQLKVVKETILNGFEKMPEALIGLFSQASTAGNFGKVIVKAYPD